MRKNLTLKNLFFGILIGSNLILPAFVFSQTCPDMTTVTGTTVNFVGELTDMGGDAITYAWFEYGKTVGLGQKTSEKALTQTGKYCIIVSDLEPSTTYYYRAGARNSAGNSYGEIKTFTTTPEPFVDLKANNSNGPITIPYNSAATLSWTSSNVNYCTASGAWSGTKPIFGSESTGNLTSSKTYILTCSGLRGSASDRVTVNVGSSPGTLTISKFVRNLSDGTGWLKTVSADPLEVISFKIQVKAEGSSLSNVVLKDTLPEKLINLRNLKVDGLPSSGDITAGLNIGDLTLNQEKIVIFDADLAGPTQFPFGETQLINSSLAFTSSFSASDTAKIIVSKKAVAGAITTFPTGLTNNLFFDSFFLPLVISSFLIWLFRSKIINFEKWLDKKKREYQIYKAQKLLQLKIAEIKAKEFLKKKII